MAFKQLPHVHVGIGFVPFSPLGRSLLTGQDVRQAALHLPRQEVTPESVFGEGDIRATLPRFTQEALATNLDLVDKVAAIAARLRATPPDRRSPGRCPATRPPA